MTLHVAVIGAGIAGACSALELARDGHRVTIVEPGEPGGEQAASFGNGAWISPASVVPMSMPGLWRKVPGYLLDPLGPLTIRVGSLLSLTPWLVRFVLAGATEAKVRRTASILGPLLRDAPDRHLALAAEAGRRDLIERRGLLYAFPDRAAFEAEALAWTLRRENGVRWTELGPEALRLREPALGPRYGFGLVVEEGAHCRDPGGYVLALVRRAETLGAVRRAARATGFEWRDGRLQAVLTDDGPLACDRAVIAAGIGSAALASAAGDYVPLASERGYHVVVADPGVELSIPVTSSDGKTANTSVRTGLRAAGQVELASRDAPPNWRRADILLDHLLRTFPALAANGPPSGVSRWMGHRPSTPDGLPVIGTAAASTDVVHAFGHGHIGLALGPVTGRLAADLVAGREPATARPLSAGRFRRGGPRARGQP